MKCHFYIVPPVTYNRKNKKKNLMQPMREKWLDFINFVANFAFEEIRSNFFPVFAIFSKAATAIFFNFSCLKQHHLKVTYVIGSPYQILSMKKSIKRKMIYENEFRILKETKH